MDYKLKFRAWDEGKKIMHYKFQWISSGNDGNDWIVFKSMIEEPVSNPAGLVFNNPYCRQQLKIMQYANAKDMNGRDIYIGDIIKEQYCINVNEPDGFTYVYHVVEFIDQEACCNDSRVIGIAIPSFLDKCLVVGNIYETVDWKERYFHDDYRFKVVIDSSNDSAEDIANNRMNVDIIFK